MTRRRSSHFMLWSCTWSVAVGLVLSYSAAALHFGSFDPRGFFAAEPGLRHLAELSEAKPTLEFDSLLDGDWETVCFVGPYHDLSRDAQLAGAEIAWIDNDGYTTVVLKRGVDYELHRFARGDVSIFELTGLPEGAACYDTTALAVAFVSADGAGFKTLRVSPR